MKLLEVKYRCMDLFYGSVDRDMALGRFHDYELSFEEVFTYDFRELSDLEKAIWSFTMVIRFARGGLLLAKNASLEESTMKALEFLKNADWNDFDLSDEDKKQLDADMREVLSYLDWLEEKRNAKDSSKKAGSAISSAEEKNKSNETIFDISFNLSKVETEAMVELFKNLTFFKPDSFGIGTENIKSEEFYQVMSDPKLLVKHCVFRASPPWNEHGHICLHYYPETGIVYIRGSSCSESAENLHEVSDILSKFAMCRDIISASVRTVEEYEYNDCIDVEMVKKLHPEMTEIKTDGDRTSPRADPEQFAAHTHEYYGMWFGCCYEMWFGKEYGKYIPLKKLKSFTHCKLNTTLDNDTVHIILYEAPDGFSSVISIYRAWAFRRHTYCDRAARVWQRRGNILSRNAGHYTYEIKEGRFPHGGIRLLMTYLDENGNHVNKCHAAKVHISECGTDGKHVFEETVELSEYERRESKREKKMNRAELLKIIDEADNMKLMEDHNRFRERITGIITLTQKTGNDGYIRDYSIINSFGEEFSGIWFRRFEKASGDELSIEIMEGAIRRCKETDFTAIEFGSVINCCGVIEYFFMSEYGKVVKVKPKDLTNFRPDGLVAETPEEFIEYLLTKEYDYHIPVTEETYDKLREAGWYEGRRVDISELVKSAEEHNVILTEEQKRFLEEYAGLKSPDPDCKHGFFIETKHRKYHRYYDNPRDWDDDYFNDVDKNSDEYKRVPVRIGWCTGCVLSMELSPNGMLMREGDIVGRTVMEGWECILN